MKPSLVKKNHRRSGSAYISVLIAFVVIIIFIAAIASLFNSNLLQTTSQERGIQAYYLARSGVDLGVAALLKTGPGGSNDTLLYKEFSTAEKPDLSSTTTLTQSITFGNGKADIIIHAISINSQRWVEVQSVGTLTATGTKKTLILQFSVDNPEQQKWKQ